MIIFAHDELGVKYLNFIKKKFLNEIEYLVFLSKTSRVYLENRKKFKNKILFWSSNNKKLFEILNKAKSKKALLVWWPKIITNSEFIKNKIVLNTHPSYLPFYKGKDPNFWSILGKGPFGVTIHRINKKIDSGEIVFQRKIKSRRLYTKLR